MTRSIIIQAWRKHLIALQGLVLCAIVFLLGNGKLDVHLPNIDISIGGGLSRYLLLFIVLQAVLVLKSESRQHALRSYLQNPLSLMILCLLAASILSDFRQENLVRVSRLVLGYLFCLAAAIEMKNRDSGDRVVMFFLVGQAVMILTGLRNTLLVSTIECGELQGPLTPMGDDRATAVSLGICVPLAFSLVFHSPKLLRSVTLALLALILISAIFIVAPLILGISLLTSAILIGIRFRRIDRWIVFGALVMGLIALVSFSVCTLFETGELSFSSVAYYATEFVTSAGKELRLVALVWGDYPLSGTGFGTSAVQFLLPRYDETAISALSYPGSFYTHWLISFGFLGLIGLVLLVWFIVRPTWSKAMNDCDTARAYFYQAALIAFFSSVFLYNPLENERLVVLLWFLCSLYLSRAPVEEK